VSPSIESLATVRAARHTDRPEDVEGVQVSHSRGTWTVTGPSRQVRRAGSELEAATLLDEELAAQRASRALMDTLTAGWARQIAGAITGGVRG